MTLISLPLYDVNPTNSGFYSGIGGQWSIGHAITSAMLRFVDELVHVPELLCKNLYQKTDKKNRLKKAV